MCLGDTSNKFSGFSAMPDLKIIYEHDAKADTAHLEESWLGSRTFIFMPDKAGVGSEWLSHVVELIPEELSVDCFGLLTSGSTGEPKLILGNKKRSENLVRLLHKLQDSEPVSETVCVLPLTYSYAFINQWLWSRVFKRNLVLTRGFSEPDHLKVTLSQARNAMLCMVGAQVPLLRQYFPEAVFPGIIRLHFAGGRFPQEQLEFLQERFPNAQIYNNYGCAEAMPRLTLRRAEEASRAAHIGFPLPGIEMTSDTDNRLLFRSPYGAVAYINDTGFHNVSPMDWIPSGDLGEPMDDGGWLLLGRANEVFKRYGEKISLPQLLTTVKKYWSGEAVFYTEVDPSGEQACILVLSPRPDEREVRQILIGFRDNHTRPHWPLRIESLKQLPLLSSGKMDIRSLAVAQGKQVHWRQRI